MDILDFLLHHIYLTVIVTVNILMIDFEIFLQELSCVIKGVLVNSVEYCTVASTFKQVLQMFCGGIFKNHYTGTISERSY